MGGGVSSRLLRHSSVGGASHSVTTSTSSSDGRSDLASFGGSSAAGLGTLCRTTPAHTRQDGFTGRRPGDGAENGATLTCVNAHKGAVVQVVAATHPPATVLGLKDLEANSDAPLDQTVLTVSSVAAAPRAAFKQAEDG